LTKGDVVPETDEYAATFKLIDADGDGKITAAELRQLMEALGGHVSEEQAAHAIRTIDQDGDGLVTLSELAGYLSSTPKHPAG
jgi:Ca2+-binding EF-hand superfamily protein